MKQNLTGGGKLASLGFALYPRARQPENLSICVTHHSLYSLTSDRKIEYPIKICDKTLNE